MSNWQLVKLRTITTKVGSGATPRGGKDSYKVAGIPLIRSQNIHFDGFRDDGLAFLDDDQAEALRSVEVHAEDVLLNITGASIGRVTTAPTRMSGARVNQHVCIIRPKPELRPSFLSWYLASPNIQHFIFDIQTGVTRQALTKEQILAFDVPLPPLDIQDKIVAEIEKQFSRLEESVTALKRIQANLKRYKAAVLKAAVEGKLTEQWRKDHPDVEPADQLLKRILAERRAKWEVEELAKMKAKGIKPKDDSWKKKYKEPAGPDTANLPDLPEGWVWATAEQLTDETRAITYGVIKLGDQVDGGIPILRSSDVRKLKIDYEGIKTISPDIAGQYRRTFLNGGEVVITVRGTLGGVAVVPSTCQGFNVSREVAMLALVEPKMAHFVAFFIASSPGESWLLRRTKGIAYTGINIETLKALPTPVAPLQEQNQIIAEIDRRLSVTEELEAAIETSLKRAERLRQTILQQAFSVS